MKALAMELVPDAMKALEVIVKSRTAGRIGAAKEILDRAFGKSPQALVHSGAIANVDLRKATDEDLLRLADVLTGIAERPEPDGGLIGAGSEEGGEGEEDAGGEPGGDPPSV
jgi:hypothetical protein